MCHVEQTFLCCRSESVVTEKLLREKEQIITELMEEGLLLSLLIKCLHACGLSCVSVAVGGSTSLEMHTHDVIFRHTIVNV